MQLTAHLTLLQANELLGVASPRNTFKKLSKIYQSIVTGMGLVSMA